MEKFILVGSNIEGFYRLIVNGSEKYREPITKYQYFISAEKHFYKTYMNEWFRPLNEINIKVGIVRSKYPYWISKIEVKNYDDGEEVKHRLTYRINDWYPNEKDPLSKYITYKDIENNKGLIYVDLGVEHYRIGIKYIKDKNTATIKLSIITPQLYRFSLSNTSVNKKCKTINSKIINALYSVVREIELMKNKILKNDPRQYTLW